MADSISSNFATPFWATQGMGFDNGYNRIGRIIDHVDGMFHREHNHNEFKAIGNTLEHLGNDVNDGNLMTVRGLAENKYNTNAIGQETVKEVIRDNKLVEEKVSKVESEILRQAKDFALQNAETQKVVLQDGSRTRDLINDNKIGDLRAANVALQAQLAAAHGAVTSMAAAASGPVGGYMVGSTMRTQSGGVQQ